ncbi:MAG: hypothetical protein KGL44_04620 [Sphingomonadales bacterium]|nr:hypothetical protein [Sphingomonadales bacterium]
MAVFASALFESEQQVHEIRNALQTLLREGDADVAAERLFMAIEALAELGHPVADLCREATLDSMIVHGWDELAYEVARADSHGRTITAIGVDLSSAGDDTPGEDGTCEPCLETSFYSDHAFAFSTATRGEIVAGYSASSSEWAGAFETIDGTIRIEGLGELHAAALRLQAECRMGDNLDGADHDAMLVAAALIAVRVHQAMREMVLAYGLPRPMAMLVGSNESYPFFDAPVVATPEYVEHCLGDWDEPAEADVDEAAYGSLTDPRAHAHLELPEALEDDANEPAAEVVAFPATSPDYPVATEHDDETDGSDNSEAPVSTGALLRRNLREMAAEAPAEAPAEPEAKRSGMFSRFMRRAG